MKFNKDNCKVVPLGRRPGLLHPTAGGAHWLGSGSDEEILDSLEDKVLCLAAENAIAINRNTVT